MEYHYTPSSSPSLLFLLGWGLPYFLLPFCLIFPESLFSDPISLLSPRHLSIPYLANTQASPINMESFIPTVSCPDPPSSCSANGMSCHGTSQLWHYLPPMPSSYSPQTAKQGSDFTFQVSLWFILSTSYLSSVGRGRCSLISLILAFALLSTSVHWSQGNLSTKQMQQCLASA